MRPIIFLSSLLLLAACTPVQADLKPATAADEVPFLERAAQDSDGAIEIIAQPAPWPGDAIITQVVTPLRVEIRNHGDVPVQVHLHEIALVNEEGRVHHAIPPVAIRGRVPSLDQPVQVVQPGFEANRFTVAGRYRNVHPQLRNYNGPFRHDVPYYRRYYDLWSSSERLPTPEMAASAMPEGVLEGGGQVTGWLYFERVSDDAERVHLTARLLPAGDDDAEPVAELHVPFATTEG